MTDDSCFKKHIYIKYTFTPIYIIFIYIGVIFFFRMFSYLRKNCHLSSVTLTVFLQTISCFMRKIFMFGEKREDV